MKRLFLFTSSLIVYCIAFISCIGGVSPFTGQFRNPKVLSEATQVEFPAYDVTDYICGPRSFHGDFSDTIKAAFTELPSDDFYAAIEDLVARKKFFEVSEGYAEERTNGCAGTWSVDGDIYRFYVIWGNGYTAPPGQRDEDDGILSVEIVKGQKEFIIEVGMW